MYKHPKLADVMNFQDDCGKAKSYQVKQLLKAIDALDALDAPDEPDNGNGDGNDE